MTRRQADVLHMAHTIESIAQTDEMGFIELGYIDTYAEIVGVDLDTADELIDEAFELLESEGVVTYRELPKDGYYKTSQLEGWEEQDREDREASRQYLIDCAQAYGDNMMGGIYGY